MKYKNFTHIVPELFLSLSREKAKDLSRYMSLTSKPLLVPIPLTAKRYRERGYNQATHIAQALAHLLNTPCAPNFLIKIKETTPQTHLKTKESRLTNMTRVFGEGEGWGATRKETPIILIDDVITTGATAKAAATTLRGGGFTTVHGIFLAQENIAR